MGIFSDIFKKSGQMQATQMSQQTAPRNSVTGKFYPTGKGPTSEETEDARKHAEELQKSRETAEKLAGLMPTAQVKSKLESDEQLQSICQKTTAPGYRDMVGAILWDPFSKREVQGLDCQLVAVDSYLFSLAQKLKEKDIQLRGEQDIQAVVDFIDKNAGPGIQVLGGFDRGVCMDGDGLAIELSFMAEVSDFGQIKIYVSEIGQTVKKKHPTWRVWAGAVYDQYRANEYDHRQVAITRRMYRTFKDSRELVELDAMVKDTLGILTGQYEPEHEMKVREALKRYYTGELKVPVRVLHTAGESDQQIFYGGKAESTIVLSKPVMLTTRVESGKDSEFVKVPAILTSTLSYSMDGTRTGLSGLTVQVGHYIEGLDPYGAITPRYTPNDRTRSRTNIYMSVCANEQKQ